VLEAIRLPLASGSLVGTYERHDTTIRHSVETGVTG
jgi:hypothetical protein